MNVCKKLNFTKLTPKYDILNSKNEINKFKL